MDLNSKWTVDFGPDPGHEPPPTTVDFGPDRAPAPPSSPTPTTKTTVTKTVTPNGFALRIVRTS